MRVFDNGQQFAQATFKVATFGTAFLSGVSRGPVVLNFPDINTTTFLTWQENSQNFMVEAAVPNTDFPSLLGFYQVSGNETHTGCTNPAFNGTLSYQAFLPMRTQSGPEFRGTAILQSSGGNYATSAVDGYVSPSGQIGAVLVSDAYTGTGVYLHTVDTLFTGSISGNTFQGTYSGFIVDESCTVTSSLSGVRS